MNNKRAIQKFWIFEFFIFCFSKFAKSAYFDKKNIFIFEISLKLRLHQNKDEITLTEAGWA